MLGTTPAMPPFFVLGAAAMSLVLDIAVQARTPPVAAAPPSPLSSWVSSKAGHRLERVADRPWRPSGSGATTTVVTVDEQRGFQTMRGFGASFLESGAINLNSLPAAKQEAWRRQSGIALHRLAAKKARSEAPPWTVSFVWRFGQELLKLLFSEEGAHMSLMKAPIPCDDFCAAGPWWVGGSVGRSVGRSPSVRPCAAWTHRGQIVRCARTVRPPPSTLHSQSANHFRSWKTQLWVEGG